MSISAYKKTISETETPRQIERRIFVTVNASLERHVAEFDAASAADKLNILSSGLSNALADNVKLWAALKLDLISPTNKMSEELRARLISLAVFVEKHTVKVLGGKAALAPLTHVNRTMIAGLSGKTPEAG